MTVDDVGQEQPPGEIGEIWHRNSGVIAGYLNNREATVNEFENGWWKSGDLGRVDADGYITIVDRKKDMIISGGFNIYATEVEAALSSHPAVLMCAVVGVPHSEWGEAVHAEVINKPESSVESEVLIDHTKKILGRYKSPKSITFVNELPLSSVGKVLRRKVREKYWAKRDRKIN